VKLGVLTPKILSGWQGVVAPLHKGLGFKLKPAAVSGPAFLVELILLGCRVLGGEQYKTGRTIEQVHYSIRYRLSLRHKETRSIPIIFAARVLLPWFRFKTH